MNNELLTIEDILGLATKPKKEETIKVKVKRLDKLIELRPLNFKELMTVITEQQSDELLIYDNCISPNLKDGKLNGIAFEPAEIVGKIFTVGEVREIAKAILDKSGFYGKDAIEIVENDIKNS